MKAVWTRLSLDGRDMREVEDESNAQDGNPKTEDRYDYLSRYFLHGLYYSDWYFSASTAGETKVLG